MRRLALGTEESHARTQAAVAGLWGYVDELFVMDALESGLVAQGIAVDRAVLQGDWQVAVDDLFGELSLSLPAEKWQVTGGRDGIHTEHLGHMLGEMQFLQRAYPGL